MTIRRPAFAGPLRFYEDTDSALRAQIEGFLVPDAAKEAALGIMSPHAGYMFSGPVAGELWSRAAVTDTVVVIAPNHTGTGEPIALWPEGAWETPLGRVEIDAALSDALAAGCSWVTRDPSAHMTEHSVEVQVPFMQYFRPDAKLVAVVVAEHRLDRLVDLGQALAQAITQSTGDVLVVASSDMSHFETQPRAHALDHAAIEQVLALDERGLWETVRDQRISMCGVCPTVAMLACTKALGATQARLVRYQTSGDVTGDLRQVVGYAGVLVS